MTKTLTLDEMLDCLEMIGETETASIIARQLEAIGDHMALILGDQLNVDVSETRREESAFAGTCARFMPQYPGQPCPDPLTNYDVTEWDEDDGDDNVPLPGNGGVAQ